MALVFSIVAFAVSLILFVYNAFVAQKLEDVIDSLNTMVMYNLRDFAEKESIKADIRKIKNEIEGK